MTDSYLNIPVPTPTQNPVPSADIRDHVFAGAKVDEFVTSLAESYADRFGKNHYTIEGLKKLALQQIYNLGWNLVGSFQGGATLNAAGDIIQDETTGIWYRWDDLSTLPKTVPTGSTPDSTGGVGDGAWLAVDVSDVLRKDLAKIDGEKLIGECPTIAVLRTIEPGYDKQRITVREHTTGTGKGGGQFRAVLSGGSYTDNNGTIIKTSGGAAWLRINADVINPFMFGGLGNGSANDTAALQAMASAASAATYVQCRIPAGTWLSSGVTITGNSIQLQGDGKYPGVSGTTIRALAANTTLFTCSGYGTRFSRMQLDGYENTNTFGSGATCSGVLFSRSGSADIDSFCDDLVISNMKYGTKVIGRNLKQHDVLWSNCIFPTTLQYYPGEQFRGHSITKSQFHSCGGNDANTSTSDTTRAGSVCITVTTNQTAGALADNYAGNILISDIVVDGSCFQFFKGSFSRGSVMNGISIFRSGGTGGILIKIDNTPTSSQTAPDGFTLTAINANNDFNYSSTTSQHPDNALALVGCKGGVVAGSLFSKMLGHGITLSNCDAILLNTLELKNPGFSVTTAGAVYDAINIDGTCTNISIGKLTVRNTQGSPQLRSVVNCAGTAHWDADEFVGDSYSNLVLETGTGRVSGSWTSGSLSQKKKIVYASAVSTIPDGNYLANDEVHFQPLPTTGTAYKGAVCVTSGTKSTAVWRNFGALV